MRARQATMHKVPEGAQLFQEETSRLSPFGAVWRAADHESRSARRKRNELPILTCGICFFAAS